LWSGQLLVQMLSLLATLKLWGLNARKWLTAYLEACAQAGGHAPLSHPVGCPGACRPNSSVRGPASQRPRIRRS
jgi:hypothetical protein